MPFNDFLSKGSSIISTGSKILGTGVGTLQKATSALSGLENKIQNFASAGTLRNLGSMIRSRNILGAAAGIASAVMTAKASFEDPLGQDWRVRLSMPKQFAFEYSDMLSPLVSTMGLIFPYTPQIQISHSANYQALEPVHNNYPFFAYQNSKPEQITITGQFVCEDSFEARYWCAAVHYLRSVTKMNFGGTDPNVGAPPPVVRLDGYGDFVFRNVPVVVTSFSVDLPNDVDYISAEISSDGKTSYAPVKSTITVTCQPIYSREEVRNFNLQDFVNGTYLDGQGFV